MKRVMKRVKEKEKQLKEKRKEIKKERMMEGNRRNTDKINKCEYERERER
jgi:hypothetical protein